MQTNGSLTSQRLNSGSWSPFPILRGTENATPNTTSSLRSLAVNWVSNTTAFVLSQRPGNGATLLVLSLQSSYWSWSDNTRGLTSSNSSVGFTAPFAATTNASSREYWSVDYMDVGKIYPWISVFSNEVSENSNPSSNLVGSSYDGSSFRSSRYLVSCRGFDLHLKAPTG